MAQSRRRESKPVLLMVWTMANGRWEAAKDRMLDPAMVEIGDAFLRRLTEDKNLVDQTCKEIKVFWGKQKNGKMGPFYDLTMLNLSFLSCSARERFSHAK